MQTVIKVHIKCMKQGKATINCYDGKITITYNQIEVTCPMSLDDLKVFSLNYPAGINLFDDLEKEISYTNAKIEEKPVKLNTNGAHVLSYRCNHKENNVNEISWTLSDISYSYQSDMENNYYILDIPFIYLTVKLDDIYKFPNNIIVENDRHKFLFLQSDNENQTILRVENCSDDNINDLLIHMDFYFHTLVNVFEKHIYYNGKENVTVHIPHFKSKEETLRHPELQFISIGNPNTFKTFIQKSQWKSLNINDRNSVSVRKDRFYIVHGYIARSDRCPDAAAVHNRNDMVLIHKKTAFILCNLPDHGVRYEISEICLFGSVARSLLTVQFNLGSCKDLTVFFIYLFYDLCCFLCHISIGRYKLLYRFHRDKRSRKNLL